MESTIRAKKVTQRRKAFTLVEAMVALAIGSLVMGAAIILYRQGGQYFYKTTEHAQFREQSLLCLEFVARDLEQLMVSDTTKPSGKYYLTEPFELTGASYPFTKFDPVTKTEKPTGATAYEGIKFVRYHSTETNAAGQPLLVGKSVEYNVKPVSGNPQDGKNLFRNKETRPINKIPLRDIAFVKENLEVTADQIGASPSAVLTVMIVPMGGTWATWQNMTRDTVDRLKADRALVSRTFHLSGYETFYTLVLNEAFRLAAANQKDPTKPGPTGVYKAVYDDARTMLTAAQFAKVLNRFQTGGAASAPVFKDQPLYRMEYSATFDDSTAGGDKFFSDLPVQEGAKPTSAAVAGGGGGGGGAVEGGEGG